MPTSPSERDERLERILADYLHAVEAGTAPDRAQLIARNPDLAADLGSFFRNRDAMERIAEPIKEQLPALAETIGAFESHCAGVGTMIRYFGDYELLEEIARGGMGVVYRARQVSLNRIVAVKMILAGQLASEGDVQRFQTEAEAAAGLDHPNIVPIYEVGEHEGQHYFSMKLVEGGSLAQESAGKGVASGINRQRQLWAAQLLVTLARALHHAHQRRILHRDLKPANILLDAAGQPHISDFGLAKRVEGTSNLTQSGAIVGTPAYMAPEQVRAEKQLTTGVDVYSLGAILYELLTGRPPFQAKTPFDTLMLVLDHDPVPPHSIRSGIDRDLETICLKCLEKEPKKRYATAADLADDLARFLRGEPIAARPVGRVERVAKWVRRHPAAAALLAVSALAILVTIIVLDTARRDANERSVTEKGLRHEAEVARNALADEQAETRRQLDRTRRLLITGQIVRAASLVEREPTRALVLLRDTDACPTDLRDFAWGYYHRLVNRAGGTLSGHVAVIRKIALSPDGRTLATAGPDGKDGTEVLLWDVAAARRRGSLFCTGSDTADLAFSPNGKLLAVAVNQPVAVTVWHLDNPAQGRSLAAPPPVVTALAFTADNTLVTAAGQGGKVWDVASGKQHAAWSGLPAKEWRLLFPSIRNLASFAADGSRVATAVPTFLVPSGETPEKYPVRVFDVTAGKVLVEVNSNGNLNSLTLSPDGRWLAIGHGFEPATLWDLSEPRPKLFVLTAMGSSLLFSPDGRILAIFGFGHAGDPASLGTTLWDMAEGRIRVRIPGNLSPHAFTPDSKGLFLSSGTLVKLHDTQTGQLVRAFDHKGGDLSRFSGRLSAQHLAVTRDLRTLVVALTATALPSTIKLKKNALQRPVVHLWDLASRSPLDSFSIGSTFLKGSLTPDGNQVVGLRADPPQFEHWKVAERALLTKTKLADFDLAVILSPDGERFVGQQKAKVVGNEIAQSPFVIRGTRTGEEEATISVSGGGVAVAFRADSKALAFVTATAEQTLPANPKMRFPNVRQTLTLLGYPGGSPLGSVPLKSGSPSLCIFSPDGREAAVAFLAPREVGVANFETGQYRTVANGKSITAVMTWGPGGKWLAFGDTTEVCVWERPEQGRDDLPVRILRGHNKTVTALAFAPQEATLASAALEEPVRLWDVVTGQERAVLPVPEGMGAITSLAFTPDGRELRGFAPMTGRVVRWLSDAANASP